MAEPALRRLTYVEYLELEKRTGVRHEFLDGQARAMAGGTIRHSAIKVNLVLALGAALRGKPCRVYDSDLKVLVEASGLATYPDVSVACRDLRAASIDRNAAVNPIALFEVLSRSTEAWDRGDKFDHFARIPDLRDYVLVSQRIRRVEHYARQPDDTWKLARNGPGDRLVLTGTDASIPVDDVYVDLPDLDADEGFVAREPAEQPYLTTA
jgi:Uma2 family endonuclease